jgi:hypothetical protein
MKKVGVFLLVLLFSPFNTVFAKTYPAEQISPISPPVYYIGVPVVIASYFLDEAVREWTQDHKLPFLDSFTDVTNTVHSYYIIGVGAAIYFAGMISDDEKLQKSSRSAAIAAAINNLFLITLKYSTGRKRPYQEAGRDAFFEDHHIDASFPSGHTSTAFAFWGTYASYYQNGLNPYLLYVPPVLAGLARIYSDKHWFSDVTAGTLLGLTSVHLGILVGNWLFPREPIQIVLHTDLKDTVIGLRFAFN